MMGYIIDIKYTKNAINVTFFKIISLGLVFYNTREEDSDSFEFILFKIQLWKLQVSLELGVNK